MVFLMRTALFFGIALYALSQGAKGQNLLDPIPRACRNLGQEEGSIEVSTTRNEYPAGGTLMVLAEVTAGVKGIFEFYLCLEDGNTEKEECLIRVPLMLAGQSTSTFDLSTVTESGVFEIPVTIPDDISCKACTLQWRVLVEECPSDQCQVMDEEFCADISIREIKVNRKRLFGLLFSVASGLLSNIG